jgi:ADP-ribose pyrophosphatase YjhB (NUDIX family)
MNTILEQIKKIKSIADIGLLYHQTEYDRERYEQLQSIALTLLNEFTRTPIEQLEMQFPTPTDYPTAKVDIRGVLLRNDGKLLLVRESADGKWSLPGGWADVGMSPTESVVKEFKEETGLDVTPERLLAVFDKRKHKHPSMPFYVYKLVFLCTSNAFETAKGFDILDVDYFDPDHLPPLSENRILPDQIRLVLEKIRNNDPTTFVD